MPPLTNNKKAAIKTARPRDTTFINFDRKL